MNRVPIRSKWDVKCSKCKKHCSGPKNNKPGDVVYWAHGIPGVLCLDCGLLDAQNKDQGTGDGEGKAEGDIGNAEPVEGDAKGDAKEGQQQEEPKPLPDQTELDAAVNKALNGILGKAITDAVGNATKAVQEVAVKAADEAASVAASIALKQNRSLEITIDPQKPPVQITGAHFFFDRLVKISSAGIPVYMWGPAGSGKTTAALMLAKALTRDAEIDTLDPSTFRSMVQGWQTTAAEPVHTSFTRCWTKGMIYVADETDNAPGHVQTLFNSALANGHAPLAWGNAAKGEGFTFVGTGNTPGMPSREFPDRKPMSAAFKDRLYFIHWPIDPAIECASVGLPTPPAPARPNSKCEPQQWVTFVQMLREWAVANMPTLMITPRASLVGVKALALGESPDEVADALIFRGCAPDMRKKALEAVRW